MKANYHANTNILCHLNKMTCPECYQRNYETLLDYILKKQQSKIIGSGLEIPWSCITDDLYTRDEIIHIIKCYLKMTNSEDFSIYQKVKINVIKTLLDDVTCYIRDLLYIFDYQIKEEKISPKKFIMYSLSLFNVQNE